MLSNTWHGCIAEKNRGNSRANASALKIQSFYRSYRARKKAKNVLRNDFETLRTKYKSDDDMTREELISHLLFFYHKDHDASRLVKNCIQNERKLFKKKKSFFRFGVVKPV